MSKMINIIRSKQLWMSDIRKSNDYEEMQLFLPDIFYEVERLYQISPFDFSYHNDKGIEAIIHIQRDVDRFISNAFNNGSLSSYVVCFCKKSDDLSLWRGYADDGKGCALGFRTDLLSNYCQKNENVVRLEKVIYCSDEKIDVIVKRKAKTLFKALMQVRKETEKVLRGKLCEDFDFLMCILLYQSVEKILFDSLRYKCDSFKNEQEWRLYIPNLIKNKKLLYGDEEKLTRKFDKTSRFLYKKIEIKETEDDLITYLPIDITKGLLSTVICGPKNKIPSSDLDIFLTQNGFYDVKMVNSHISYI